MSYTRRDIGRLALTGLPAGLAFQAAASGPPELDERPNSRWGGVQVALHVPDSLGPAPRSADDILTHCLRLGVSAIELSAGAVETFLGAPVPPACAVPLPENGLELGLHPLEEEVLQDEIDLAQKTVAERLRRWRSAVSLAPLQTLRRHYEDAGVHIGIVNWTGLALMEDDEVEYGWRLAKALGAGAVCTELLPGGPRRLGRVADRHELRLAFHGDSGTGAADFEAAFSHGRFIGAALDVDHWVAGGHGSPLPFIARHGSRITHIHLTSRQRDDGTGRPFGANDMAVREVLDRRRSSAWAFEVTIADGERDAAAQRRLATIAAQLDYCRACLTA